MTTFLKSTVAKATLGLFVSVAMFAGASNAAAITQAEATAIITALNLSGSQAAVIQALVSGGTPAPVVSSHDFGTATLRVGSKGSYVSNLQMFLNSAINAGLTTDGNFGPATRAKVAAWQAANGLTADGVFGPASMAKAKSTAAPVVVGGTTPTTPTTPVAGFAVNGKSQGSITEMTVGSSDESEVNAGESDVEIYAADVELDDNGPLLVQSVDVWFGETTAGDHSSRPWDYFTEVSLMIDGKEVATMDADSSSDWSSVTDGKLDDTTREYRMRFSGLNSVLASDETTKISVAVSSRNSIDSEDDGATWNITLGDVRVMDETGFMVNYDATADDVQDTFTVGESDTASLSISKASTDPKATVIEVSTSSDTNGVTIHAFEIEEKNDVDVNIEEITATFVTTGAENTVIKRAYLFQGNTKVGDEAMTANGAVTFDNLDIDIDADDSEVFTVRVDFFNNNSGVRYVEGATVAVTINDITLATDANDNDEDDITVTGSSTSSTHELRTEGIRVTVTKADTIVTANDTANDDNVQFLFEVDIATFGTRDIYINRDVAHILGADAGDIETVYSIEKSTGADLTSVSATITTSSSTSTVVNATGDAGAYGGAYNGETFFKIYKGQTGKFTISISGTNQTNSKQVRALLNNIEWTADLVESGDVDGLDEAMNDYTFNLGTEAATPFRVLN